MPRKRLAIILVVPPLFREVLLVQLLVLGQIAGGQSQGVAAEWRRKASAVRHDFDYGRTAVFLRGFKSIGQISLGVDGVAVKQPL